jgi:hypothetical protein
MPNIIEQQDLLKGIPDNRLAMMMQNPTGDIPPFLVAAEAQRRQAIRQQFAGGPQESVVDTLTKQLAGVPQNIQAQSKAPPQMPPPMMQQMPQQQMPQQPQQAGQETAGVAALQQQMPQQAPQQAMRRGGVVQRYDVGGSVQSSFYNPQPGASNAEQMAQTYMFLNPGMTYEEALQRAGIGQPLARPTVGELAAAQAGRSGVTGVGNYSVLRRPSEAPLSESAIEEAATGSATPPQRAPIPPGASMGMSFTPRMPDVTPEKPVSETDPGKKDTSQENKGKMSLEEYRRQLEGVLGVNAEDSEYIKDKIRELYGDSEPSNWEKSQKWFAAAQAAIQPGQNNWQAAINAAAAFGGGMADERASDREGQRELAEAMLRYEMGDMQQRRQSEQEIAKQMLQMQMGQQEAEAAAAAARRKEQLGAYEFYAGGAKETIDAANQSIRSLVMERKDYIDSLPKDMATGQPVTADGKPVSAENDPVLRSIEEQIRSYRDMISGASAQRQKALGGYGAMTGTDPSVLTYSPGRLTPYGG